MPGLVPVVHSLDCENTIIAARLDPQGTVVHALEMGQAQQELA